MIRAEGLGRTFQGRAGEVVHALVDLDLRLPAGALVVVRGPSGCGKSTLLNLIGLLDQPTRGRLEIDGVAVSGLDRAGRVAFRRDRVGFLFQDGGLIEPMTVEDNLMLPLAYRSVPRRDRAGRAGKALATVGLGSRLRSQVGDLSGGERQRIGLARALISEPALLVCDEPTAALDSDNSVAVAALLRGRAAEGVSVVCSSHDPLLIARADVVVELSHGRLRSEAG
jgi:putative ABC transport system ATP-binding protein